MVDLKKIRNAIKSPSESTFGFLTQLSLSLFLVSCLNLSLISRGTLFAIIFSVGLITRSFVRALTLIFASIALTTAGVSLAVMVRPGLVISDYLIALMIICATFLFTFRDLQDLSGSSKNIGNSTTDNSDYLLLLPLALMCVLVRRWVTTNNPVAIFNLFSSEDNSAWLSTAKGFALGNNSASGFTHPTAQSPAVGPIIALISALTRLGSRSMEARPHVLALATVRNTFALLIISASITAGAISRNAIKRRTNTPKAVDIFTVFFCVIAEFMLFNLLFIQHGFLSFMGAAVFALLAIEFCTSTRNSNPLFSNYATAILLLVGMGSSWWGTTPISAFLLFILVLGMIKRYKDSPKTIASSTIFCIIVGGLVLNQMRDLIFTGSSTLINAVSSTGTVEELSPLAIVIVVGIILAGISQSLFNSQARESTELLNVNTIFVFSTIFAMSIWITSFIQTGAPNYAAYKIIYFLILLTVPIAFSFPTFIVHPSSKSNFNLASFSQPIFTFFLIGMISTTFGYIKLSTPGPDLGFKNKIIEALDANPDSIVVCVHSDEENRIKAYVCSRFAQALSRSESPLTQNWMQAIVYPDQSPNGESVPQKETSGGQALKAFNETLAANKRPISVVVFPDPNFDPANFEWGPEFWWLSEIEWNRVQLMR
jgi:hypothetical protein